MQRLAHSMVGGKWAIRRHCSWVYLQRQTLDGWHSTVCCAVQRTQSRAAGYMLTIQVYIAPLRRRDMLMSIILPELSNCIYPRCVFNFLESVGRLYTVRSLAACILVELPYRTDWARDCLLWQFPVNPGLGWPLRDS